MVSSSVFIGFSPQTQTWYLSIVLHQHILIFLKIYPKKARKSRHFKPKISHFGHFHSFNWNYIPIFICICSLYTLSIGKTWFNVAKNWIIILQLNLKQLHKVNFYPSDNNFTQALLVCLWQISSLLLWLLSAPLIQKWIDNITEHEQVLGYFVTNIQV